jgi:hypothetical protein
VNNYLAIAEVFGTRVSIAQICHNKLGAIENVCHGPFASTLQVIHHADIGTQLNEAAGKV